MCSCCVGDRGCCALYVDSPTNDVAACMPPFPGAMCGTGQLPVPPPLAVACPVMRGCVAVVCETVWVCHAPAVSAFASRCISYSLRESARKWPLVVSDVALTSSTCW